MVSSRVQAVLRDRPDIPRQRLKDIRAAMECEAEDVIVTRNLRDFPDAALARCNISGQHPDEFVRHLVTWRCSSSMRCANSMSGSSTGVFTQRLRQIVAKNW